MKIVFMGTPDFAVTALDALVEAGHEILCAYCQPPRPAGRGKKDRPTPVHNRALELGIPVRHPVSLKGTVEQAEFAALGADLAVVVAYGLILPQAILNAPVLGCLNIHASLLPRWRGAAPIQRAIMAGDNDTGVTIMQMDAGLDTGPMLMSQKISISDHDTAETLHNKLADLGSKMIVKTLASLDELVPQPQPEHGVTYADKISKSEARVRFDESANRVSAKIRGLAPFPGAYVEISGERIKLLGAKVVSGNGQPGQIFDGFTIGCAQNAVQITKAQRPGKRPMDTQDFLRGFVLPESL